MYYHSYSSEFPLYNLAPTKYSNELFIGCDDGSIIRYCIITQKETNLFKYHTSGVIGIKISSTDKYLLSAAHESLISILDVSNSKFFKSLNIEPALPESICFTDNEKLACIGSNDSLIRIWSFTDPSPAIKLIGHNGPIITIRCLKDHLLVSCSQDATLKVWDLLLNSEIETLKGHKSWINCFVISNKQEIIASGGGDYTVKAWGASKFQEIFTFSGHIGEIYSLAFNLNDTLLASGSQDKTVRVWNLKTKNIQFIQDTHISYISYVKLIGNNLLVSVSYRNILVDNLTENRNEVLLEGHSGLITDIEVVDNSTKIISCSYDKTVKFWDINDKDMKVSLDRHSNNVSCVLVTLDFKFIVSGGWDGLVIVWRMKEKKPLHVMKSHSHYVSALGQTNDGLRVLSASWDTTVKMWEVATGTLIHTFTGPKLNIFYIYVNHNSEYFSCSSSDYRAWFWSIDLLENYDSIQYTDAISGLEFNTNLEVVISTLDGSLDAYDLKKKFIMRQKKFEVSIIGSRFSLDCKKVILVLNDKTIRILDFDSFIETASLKEHHAKWPIQLNLISKSLISIVSDDHELKVFDIINKSEISSFHCTSAIKKCVITGCGNCIISGTKNGSILIFNISEKRVEATLKGHTDQVESLALSKASKYLISGSRDTTIKIWKLCEYFKQFSSRTAEDTDDMTNKTFDLDYGGIRYTKKNRKGFENDSGKNLYPPLIYNGFKQRFAKGMLPVESDCKIMLYEQVNLAHLYAYLGYYKSLERALALGCPIRRDLNLNSPLHYSIIKDSQKSTDVILQFLIDLSKNEGNLSKYFEYNYALRDDLFRLLKLSSPLVPAYLESIFSVSKDKMLPNSIRCLRPPVLLLTQHTKIYFEEFKNECSYLNINMKYESFVEFRTTPFMIELTNGTPGFFQLVKSLAFTRNQKVFTTKLIKTILDYKFKIYYKLILISSAILAANLITMLICITREDHPLFLYLIYLSINLFMGLHEVLQIRYEGPKVYISCRRNIIDTSSIIFTITWISGLIIFEKDLTFAKWFMVFFNFLKGLNIFKAFNNTRFYIALLIRIITETYSFLIIFFYSTLAFGGLYIASVGNKYDCFNMLWKIPYELNFGVFDASTEANVEYVYFMLASLLNIVMMLNLLIAILSDSFDKFQIEALELDYKEKMDVIVDIESLFLVIKTKTNKGFLQLCDLDSKETEEEPWGGKIKEIEQKIEKMSKEVNLKFKVIEKNQRSTHELHSRIEGKIDKLLSLRQSDASDLNNH